MLEAPTTRQRLATSKMTKRSAMASSQVTNGRKLLHGIDARTTAGRRYRDLCAAFAADLGGEEGLLEAERVLIRQAAASAVASEKFQAALLRDEEVDLAEATRLANASARMLNLLRLRRRDRVVKPEPSFAESLAGIVAEEGKP
jgi:hypothetical protein